MKFTRHGFWELLIGTLALLLFAVGTGYWTVWWIALLAVPVLLFLWAFFRDPERAIPAHPTGRQTIVSPADGTISDIIDFEEDPILHEPTVRIGIFLSVFNVHVNRSPCDGVVKQVIYRKGKFLNALDHSKASEHNESNTIVLVEPGDREKPVAVVKQIVGLIARRIICTKVENDSVARGERIGMIKFGSRTELSVPKRLNPKILATVGQKVRGGADVLLEVDAFSTPACNDPTDAALHDPELEPLVRPTPA